MSEATVTGNAGILDTLTLRYGPTPDSEPLTIRPGAMTVLVGPNNSGKSLLLREIGAYVSADTRWSYEYLALRKCMPRLPESGSLRASFEMEIRTQLEGLTLKPGDLPMRDLIRRFLSGQFEGMDNGARLTLAFQSLSRGGELLTRFGNLVAEGHAAMT
jgi:energy-coupling factor transporter ATP-binding protein EcfA2